MQILIKTSASAIVSSYNIFVTTPSKLNTLNNPRAHKIIQLIRGQRHFCGYDFLEQKSHFIFICLTSSSLGVIQMLKVQSSIFVNKWRKPPFRINEASRRKSVPESLYSRRNINAHDSGRLWKSVWWFIFSEKHFHFLQSRNRTLCRNQPEARLWICLNNALRILLYTLAVL